jgi:hypothetical protein
LDPAVSKQGTQTANPVVSVTFLSLLDLPVFFPVFTSGVFIGASLRDLGTAIKAVRAWPIQRELFDWPKIDGLAKQVAEMQSKTGR